MADIDIETTISDVKLFIERPAGSFLFRNAGRRKTAGGGFFLRAGRRKGSLPRQTFKLRRKFKRQNKRADYH